VVDFIRKADAKEMLLATKEFVASLDAQCTLKQQQARIIIPSPGI